MEKTKLLHLKSNLENFKRFRGNLSNSVGSEKQNVNI